MPRAVFEPTIPVNKRPSPTPKITQPPTGTGTSPVMDILNCFTSPWTTLYIRYVVTQTRSGRVTLPRLFSQLILFEAVRLIKIYRVAPFWLVKKQAELTGALTLCAFGGKGRATGRKITASFGNVTVRGEKDGKGKGEARRRRVSENIYYSHLSSVALLLQPERKCFASYNSRKVLGSLSLRAIAVRSSPPSHVSTCNGQRSLHLFCVHYTCGDKGRKELLRIRLSGLFQFTIRSWAFEIFTHSVGLLGSLDGEAAHRKDFYLHRITQYTKMPTNIHVINMPSESHFIRTSPN
jgi:hypothetical protein